MVADLVRDDVGLGEVAGRPEPVAQIAVERQIDVELPVAGTVEGPDRRLGEAAGRVDGAAEQHEPRLLVLPAHLAEELAATCLRCRRGRPRRNREAGRRGPASPVERSARDADRPDRFPEARRSGRRRTTPPGARAPGSRCHPRRRPHGRPACRGGPRCCRFACPSAIASLASASLPGRPGRSRSLCFVARRRVGKCTRRRDRTRDRDLPH